MISNLEHKKKRNSARRTSFLLNYGHQSSTRIRLSLGRFSLQVSPHKINLQVLKSQPVARYCGNRYKTFRRLVAFGGRNEFTKSDPLEFKIIRVCFLVRFISFIRLIFFLLSKVATLRATVL